MTNALIGTPHYISPEAIRGADVDHRADLYSLGVLFYEMLTGERPFRADRLMKLLEAHISGDIPALPAPLERFQPLLEGLLAKLPDDRFQNAHEFIAALDAT
jgi:serine/threonine protein kinase